MKALIFTDIHLTDNPREEYRWRVFGEAITQVLFLKEVTDILILGDLTDKKDNHSASLVNRLVREVKRLAELAPVTILKGNHDYLDAEEPFFGFLGDLPRVTYHGRPHNCTDLDAPYLYLPHTFNPSSDWGFIDLNVRRKAVFMHQTVRNATMSNGIVLDGGEVQASWFKGSGCPVFSGDVHVPQRVGSVIYVGSPHPVKFGDEYKPRMIYFSGKKVKSLPVRTIRRVHAEVTRAKDLHRYKLREGDHLKVTVKLQRSHLDRWSSIRASVLQTVDQLGVELFGVTAKVSAERVALARTNAKGGNATAFDRYCVRQGVSAQEEEFATGVMRDVEI